MRRARIPAVLAIACALATIACQRDDSILLVEVSGDLALAPSQLSVNITANGRSRGLLVPPDPTTISLPTSFTVELDRSITGPVTMSIDALDGYGYVMASGSTVQTHIIPGGQTIINIMLLAAMP